LTNKSKGVIITMSRGKPQTYNPKGDKKMFTANEARKNVEEYESKITSTLIARIESECEEIGKKIEELSKNGDNNCIYYNKTNTIQLTKAIMSKLQEYGYTVSYSGTVTLRICW
jgi:hypothetical protein